MYSAELSNGTRVSTSSHGAQLPTSRRVLCCHLLLRRTCPGEQLASFVATLRRWTSRRITRRITTIQMNVPPPNPQRPQQHKHLSIAVHARLRLFSGNRKSTTAVVVAFPLEHDMPRLSYDGPRSSPSSSHRDISTKHQIHIAHFHSRHFILR